jgi:hypothetical protein
MTGKLWPCVSACTVLGCTSLVFLGRPSMKDGLPHAARDEVREQRDVGVRDVVVGDAARLAVADARLGEQVVEVGLPDHGPQTTPTHALSARGSWGSFHPRGRPAPPVTR